MVGIKDFEMPVNCGDCYLTSIKSVSNPWDMICSCNLKDIDINERTRAEHCPLVETIPKADYENRLKADLAAMLEELDLQIDELYFPQTYPKYMEGRSDCLEEIKELIQEKINSLKEAQNDRKENI